MIRHAIKGQMKGFEGPVHGILWYRLQRNNGLTVQRPGRVDGVKQLHSGILTQQSHD